jgi:amidase
VSAQANVADALARIRSDRSGAVVTVSADALRDAERVDQAHEDAGALAGIPFTVKDVIATAGLRTTAASRALADHVPEHDAPAVARLRSAGAVLVGKTNCSELALSAWTGNPLFSETRNPRHAGRSAGGSSGGCAAAVAGGLVPISLGTDYGGSIRFPACCCEVIGLRPTPGRIPSAGQLPTPDHSSPRARFSLIGPLGRTVGDVSAAFEALADDVRRPDAARRAVALIDGPSQAAVELVTDLFGHMGVEVGRERLPWLRAAADTFAALRALDTFADLRSLADALGTPLKELIAAAPRRSQPAERVALERRATQLVDEALGDLSPQTVLVLPVADGPIPPPAGRPVDLERLWPARAISLLGFPAVAIGGVQLVGAPTCDETVLAAAALIEPKLR